jgi:1,4-alpha-glucan branching enzyme
LGFEWIEVENGHESIIAFLRKEKDPRNALLFALNFSAVSRPGHRIGVPYPGAYTQIFSSNAAPYSGLNDGSTNAVVLAEEIPWHGREFSISVRLPALSAVVLKPAAPARRPYVF